jgi:flagellar motor switch protein FliN
VNQREEKLNMDPAEVFADEPPAAHEHIVQPMRLTPLPEGGDIRPQANAIDFLYDINLQLSVELGKTEMTLREVMEMGVGTVIALNKLAGEPVDILVNGKVIARGEVVVVDDMFGMRVIDVLSPYDRIRSL